MKTESHSGPTQTRLGGFFYGGGGDCLPSILSMTLDDADDWPIKRHYTSAVPGQQSTKGLPSSVFDLAHVDLKLRNKSKFSECRTLHRIERLEGLTRCTVISEQETEEWKERELQRRARQIVPRAPKSAKTMSKRFAALVAAG